MEADRAPAKTFCRAAARGPGVDATGTSGGGDGDPGGRTSILAKADAFNDMFSTMVGADPPQFQLQGDLRRAENGQLIFFGANVNTPRP
jgi:hypothetical protein